MSRTPRQHGSALCWLAHLDLLKHVVMAGFNSALILEDDADWDVNISIQMQRISGNIRELLNVSRTDSRPYGTDWDLLWIGHCGERADTKEYIDYVDDTRVSTEQYQGFYTSWWTDKVPEGYRRIQPSVKPICTYGYAVTAVGAQKVLRFLASGKDEAFDVALQHQCRGKTLRCITVVPQIIQHYKPPEGSGYVSEAEQESGAGESSPDNVLEEFMGTTDNILHSARCKALYGSQCLPPSVSRHEW
jgi:GR25 family glycosyltransferase involved in LPS biosynthesis